MIKGSWSTGLIKTLNDPTKHIISTNIGVVIKDKYPKAMCHYLVMPKDDIPSIFHVDLLSELYLLAINVIEVTNGRKEEFKIGFHAQPSMQRLHLHVISRDFVSPCLKTRKHWNSFNTKLFLPYDELVESLKKNGQIKQIMEKDDPKKLAQTELKCNQCNLKPKNMPDLKKHLLTHLKQRARKDADDDL